jgi:hypothetical protein
LGLAAGLVGWLAWRDGFVSLHGPAISVPEQGAVAKGRYTNAYFDLSYPLPQQWSTGLDGPGPSETGYYVLSTLTPTDDLNGTILIAAQDIFFSIKSYSDVAAAAIDFRQAMSQIPAMTIDREPRKCESLIATSGGWTSVASGSIARCSLPKFVVTW